MGGATTTTVDKERFQRDLLKQRIYGNHQAGDRKGYKTWDQLSDAERANYEKHGYDEARFTSEAEANYKRISEQTSESVLGKDYIPEGQTRSLNDAPLAPDALDKATLARRRSLLLSGAGVGRSSTFASNAGGTPMLGRTFLGGY